LALEGDPPLLKEAIQLLKEASSKLLKEAPSF
jgi:hypothetical protein